MEPPPLDEPASATTTRRHRRLAVLRWTRDTSLVLLGASLVSFVLTYLAPGDLAHQLLTSQGIPPTDDMVTAMRARLGLDRPLWEQYVAWSGRVLRGDLGTSLSTGTDIASDLAERLPRTAALTVTATIACWAAAVPVGITAALHRGRLPDIVARALAYTSSAVPGFVVALLVLDTLGLRLRLLPIAAEQDLTGLAMPALTLALTHTGWQVRQVRTLAVEILQRPFVAGLRLRGLSEARIGVHVLRNAAAPLVTLAGTSFGAMLAGSVVVEAIFSWRGIGHYALSAIAVKDHPVVQAYVIWCVLVVLVVNTAADLLAFALDPRLRTPAASPTPGGAPRPAAPAHDGTEKPPLPIEHVDLHRLDTTPREPAPRRRRGLDPTWPWWSLLAALGLVALTGAASAWLTPFDPTQTQMASALQPPGSGHLLGTDHLGRDVWARVLAGIGPTLTITGTVMALTLGIGTLLGVVAGSAGGAVDATIQRVTAVFQAFPEFVLALALAAMLGPGFWSIVAALTAPAWTHVARYARILTMEVADAPYIHVARMNAVPPGRILTGHVVPNIAGPLVAVAASDLGGVILNLATLSFVGLGLPQPSTEWGTMIAEARPFLTTAPWLVLAPGAALFVVTSIANLLADVAQMRTTPGARSRRAAHRKASS